MPHGRPASGAIRRSFSLSGLRRGAVGLSVHTPGWRPVEGPPECSRGGHGSAPYAQVVPGQGRHLPCSPTFSPQAGTPLQVAALVLPPL